MCSRRIGEKQSRKLQLWTAAAMRKTIQDPFHMQSVQWVILFKPDIIEHDINLICWSLATTCLHFRSAFPGIIFLPRSLLLRYSAKMFTRCWYLIQMICDMTSCVSPSNCQALTQIYNVSVCHSSGGAQSASTLVSASHQGNKKVFVSSSCYPFLGKAQDVISDIDRIF